MSETYRRAAAQPESVANLIEGRPRGHVFGFVLYDGTGGTWRTQVAVDVDQMKQMIFNKFGQSAKIVEMKGGNCERPE